MTDFSNATDHQLDEMVSFYRRQRNATAFGTNQIANAKYVRLVNEAVAEQQRRSEIKAEEAEPIVEISKEKLMRYTDKASEDITTMNPDKKTKKRVAGIKNAVQRFSKMSAEDSK